MKQTKHKELEKQALVKAEGSTRSLTLGKAPEDKAFGLKDGRKLRTLYELVDELETMNDGMFKDYVNDMKNDFANWIEGVFKDKPLGKELRAIKTRIAMQQALLKHLVRELRHFAEK